MSECKHCALTDEQIAQRPRVHHPASQPLSAAEAAIVARFDAAEPAPESWRPNRAARNTTCCEHAASDHDTHGCAVNLSTYSRTYERCHGLVTIDRRAELALLRLDPFAVAAAFADGTDDADDRTGQQ